MTGAPVEIVAAIITDAEGRTLLVRKRGTSAFMQPGGKREPGEDDIAALAREIREELGCEVIADSVVLAGVFRAPAANETGREVVAQVYRVDVEGEPKASAEIIEAAWIDPASPGTIELAPLTRDHVLPLMANGSPAKSMEASWPDLAGRLVNGEHVLPVRIYFEDTDFSGVVYHGSYVRFLERGRTDFLRLLGVGHDALDKGEHGEPLAFAVARMVIDFRRPARIDDLVEVVTKPGELTGARVVLLQSIRRGAETLVTAEVTVAMINAAGQPRRWPETIRNKISGR